MLKDHRHICTGSACKVCRHLGRQRAARALKRGGGSPRPDGPVPPTAGARRPALVRGGEH